MLRTIHLHGPAAEFANLNTIELDVDTPVSLFLGLQSQIKGFRQFLSEHKVATLLLDENKNVTDTITNENFVLSLGRAKEIHLVPETEGAGLEAALIAAGINATIASVITYIAVNVLLPMALGAIAAALAGSPKQEGGARDGERPSFLYNGAVNVMEQGYPVPLVYGTHTVGSTVISVGIDVEEIAPDAAEETKPNTPTAPPVEQDQYNPNADLSGGTGGQ